MISLLALILEPFKSAEKLSRRYGGFPYSSCLPNMQNLPHCQPPPPEGYVCYSHEPALTRHCHPKSVAYIKVALDVVHSMALDKCLTACIHLHSIIVFTTLKIPVFYLFIPPILPIPGKHWSLYCLPNFVFFRTSCSWNYIVCSLLRLTFYLIKCI